jgi:hypothetical protein
MTPEEALIYLPAQDEDERDDLYEEKLFECKQFLINRFPNGKIIQSRIDKLLKVEEAYIALGGSVMQFTAIETQEPPTSTTIQPSFSWYHSERNALKLKVNGAKSAREMDAYLQQLLKITKWYARNWSIELTPSDPNPITSKEPDPMELQTAFKYFENADELTMVALQSLTDDHLLKMEAKRLTFWLKSEE